MEYGLRKCLYYCTSTKEILHIPAVLTEHKVIKSPNSKKREKWNTQISFYSDYLYTLSVMMQTNMRQWMCISCLKMSGLMPVSLAATWIGSFQLSSLIIYPELRNCLSPKLRQITSSSPCLSEGDWETMRTPHMLYTVQIRAQLFSITGDECKRNGALYILLCIEF